MKKTYFVICGKYQIFKKTLKYHTFAKKTLILSIICNRCGNEDEKYLKSKNKMFKE